ncbi:MAG: ribose transport system permease protein [Sphingomonadales bacterium]|nr:ribose transport system permease protein [Sphingomonadales bacterium]
MNALKNRVASPFAAIWVATILLYIVSPFVASGSLGHSALQGMLPFAGILAIAAIGQTLVIQQGGLDLSVPGIFSLGAVLIVVVPGGNSGDLIPALLVVAAAGLAGGFLNGVAVTRFGITPLVATLGSNAIFIGVVIQVTGGSIAFKATKNWQTFTSDKVFGIPILAVIAVIATIIVALFIARTVWGRRFVLVGSSPLAARAAGLSVERYQVSSYAAAGLCYALAGALLSGYLQSPPLLPGNEYLLPTIAAVVLGGTALGGGRGSVIATAVGVLFLSQLEQVISALGAKTSVDYLIQGVIVALGMGLRNVPWNQILPGRRGEVQAAMDTTSHDTASDTSRTRISENKEEESIDVSKT